ncbi:hypothetical protein [Phenylobacterium sp.]|uniref:hypothetical protein n=1 Tax=Phenylobacterium sp. TaxID=1871053 RepID=UPI00286D9276|nr:hypothetical protein [Phenylobacterium sp.]
MKALWAAALLVLAGCATAPPPSLVAGVHEDIKYDMPPVRPAVRLFAPVDISHDGVPDWHVDYERQGMAWCGTGGCTQKLFVSRPGGGHVLAFEEQVRQFALRLAPDGAVLDIEIHGTNCGLSGVNACHRSFRWDDAQGRFIEQPNRQGDGRLAGPLFQTVPVAGADYPPAVGVALSELTAACERLGGKYEGALVSRSPDLTGDGRPDWIVGSEYSGCIRRGPDGEAAPVGESGLRIISGDAVILSLDGPVHAVDVATAPATFISVTTAEDCGGYDQEGCMETPYRWDAAAGRLVAGTPVRGRSLWPE